MRCGLVRSDARTDGMGCGCSLGHAPDRLSRHARHKVSDELVLLQGGHRAQRPLRLLVRGQVEHEGRRPDAHHGAQPPVKPRDALVPKRLLHNLPGALELAARVLQPRLWWGGWDVGVVVMKEGRKRGSGTDTPTRIHTTRQAFPHLARVQGVADNPRYDAGARARQDTLEKLKRARVCVSNERGYWWWWRADVSNDTMDDGGRTADGKPRRNHRQSGRGSTASMPTHSHSVYDIPVLRR